MSSGGCSLSALLQTVSLALVPHCTEYGSSPCRFGDAVSLCFPTEFSPPGSFGCFSPRTHQAGSFISTHLTVVFVVSLRTESYILSNVIYLNLPFLYFSCIIVLCLVWWGGGDLKMWIWFAIPPWLGFLFTFFIKLWLSHSSGTRWSGDSHIRVYIIVIEQKLRPSGLEGPSSALILQYLPVSQVGIWCLDFSRDEWPATSSYPLWIVLVFKKLFLFSWCLPPYSFLAPVSPFLFWLFLLEWSKPHL